MAARPATGSWLARHWFLIFAAGFGPWVWLPFLAPVFMHMGWSAAGRGIYMVYSLFCHQLPERSLFLFGNMPMHPLGEIQAAGQNTINPLVLRQFLGNETMGWKVAWSDRMISFYTSIWVFALLWRLLRSRIRFLPLWGGVLLLLPLLLDGGTHALSDLAGIGQGFRDSNLWLAVLTRHALPAAFYAGDALGSFNSWMRLISGVLAGLGLAWFAFPYMEESFGEG